MSDASTDPLRWLVELREHLVPALELLNTHGDALLPAARGDTSARLRRLAVGASEPAIDTLIHEARTHRAVAFAVVEGLRVAAVVLTDNVGEQVTLLLAERADAGRETARRAELTRVASWLARSVARAPLAAPGDPVRDWHELSVLHRMLNRAVASGSITAVMHAFVEALAVWADIDTRAYILDRAGCFTLEVALAGADAALAPRTVDAGAVAGIVDATPLDPSQADALGFAPDTPVVVAPLRSDHTATWLLAYLGTASHIEHERLALFHDLLRPALQSAAEVEASRLMWSMMQQLIGDRAVPSDAATDALSELEQAGLCTAAMLVLRRANEVIMRLGTAVPHGRGGGTWPAAAVQHFTLAVPEPFLASLTLWRPADRPFTGRETRLGAIGASVLASWTASALRRGHFVADAPAAQPTERRHRRPEAAPDVSLLVIRPDEQAITEDLRELWVGEIRRRLRPADVAGSLASGEIGILLAGAGADDAHAVASRFRSVFGQQGPFALLDGAPIGIATGRSQASDGYSMLRQARADATGEPDDTNAPSSG